MNLENKKQIAIIALAVGLGLVAAILTGNHIQSRIQHETSVLAKEFKKSDQAYRKEMDLLRQEIKTLQTRQVAMAQRQPQQVQKVADPVIPKSSLALRTPPGKRALTVMIDSLSAVGGLINPGDYVDILGHLNIPPQPGISTQADNLTAVIFQNMQVLAVGTALQATGSYEAQSQARSLNITFAVDPEEAGLLTFAQKNGTLQLVLRAPQETDSEMLQIASWETLSDYVLDRHGMELVLPRARAVIGPAGGQPQADEVKPYIQIFRRGQER